MNAAQRIMSCVRIGAPRKPVANSSMEKKALHWMAERAPIWADFGPTHRARIRRTDWRRAFLRDFAVQHAMRCCGVIVCVISIGSVTAWMARWPAFASSSGRAMDSTWITSWIFLGRTALMCGLGFSGLLHWPMAVAMLVGFCCCRRELSGYLYLVLLSAVAGHLWAHGDSHSADHRKPGTAARPLCDRDGTSLSAVRPGRSDRGHSDVRYGRCDRFAAHCRTLQAGTGGLTTTPCATL